MISPLNTVITNKTRERRRYRFTRFFISLAPQGDKEGGDTFRFNGDVFTLTDNDEEAQQLLYDHRLGYIELKYELDDSVKAESAGEVAKLSEKAELTLIRRSETDLDGKESTRMRIRCFYTDEKTHKQIPIPGVLVTFNDNPSVTADENGIAETWVPHSNTGYDLYATKPGYTDYYQERYVKGDFLPIQAEMHPARGKQTFLVLGTKGIPIPKATVIIERVGTQITDFRGIAEFENVPLKNSKKAGSKVNPTYNPKCPNAEINDGKFKYHVYAPGYVAEEGDLPKDGTAARQWIIKMKYDWPTSVEPSENQ